VEPSLGAFLVVDGVGGQAAGERAAEIAVEAIRATITASLPVERRVREAITAANNRIFQEAQAHPSLAGMACVLTLALVENGRGHDRARGRFAAVPDVARRDAQAHERTIRRSEKAKTRASSPRKRRCSIRAATKCFREVG